MYNKIIFWTKDPQHKKIQVLIYRLTYRLTWNSDHGMLATQQFLHATEMSKLKIMYLAL